MVKEKLTYSSGEGGGVEKNKQSQCRWVVLGGRGGGKFFSERIEEDLVPKLQERKLSRY